MAKVTLSTRDAEILYAMPKPPTTLEKIVRLFMFINRTAAPSYEELSTCFQKAINAGIVRKDELRFVVDDSWYRTIHSADSTANNEIESMLAFEEDFVGTAIDGKTDESFSLSRSDYDAAIASVSREIALARVRVPSKTVRWLQALWQRFFPIATLGQRGEAAAARYLRRRGYKIVARGSRGALGELDLVAVDGRTVVFVEVKTRRSQDAGHPADAVDDDKQRRMTRLAVSYLRRHGLLDYPARFDVVAITWPAGRGKPTIEHFQHAFPAVGYEGMFS